MSEKISLPNDFTPRSYQRRYMAYFDKGGKRAVWVVHRRGGKDLTAMHQTCKEMHRRPGQYWHIYPTFAQARKAVWEGFRSDGKAIIDNVFPPEIVRRRNDQQMRIELHNGASWQLMGSDKIELVGAGPFGVVFSEYALARARAAELISPMLMENKGWEAYITTPRGKNHAFDLFERAKKNPAWFCEVQTLYDTLAYDPNATMAEERARGKPEALIRQEYLCDWTAANAGAVYGDLIEILEKAGAISDFEHPRDGIHTSFDIGFTDAAAIWFWRPNHLGGIDVIDHYENHGKPASHYFDIMEAKPYEYAVHWLPHDARAKTFASGVSTQDLFLERYPGRAKVGPGLSLLDGLQAGRWLLQKPTRFHTRAAESKCGEGATALKALREYQYEYDEEKKTFGAKPLHDWSSHTADAFRYAAVVTRYVMPASEPQPAPPIPKVPSHAEAWNLEDLFKMNEEDKGRRRI